MILTTRLDPRAITTGPRVGVSAAALGEPLMPWQTSAAALIGAIDPDDPARWRYPLVVITVPRQAGKSTLLRAVHTDRILKPLPSGRPAMPTTIWMTAQKGKDARRRFNDLAERIKGSAALKSVIHHRRSIGSEALALGNVALSPFAPTPEALHGETTPFVSVDEAWAFDETRAAALLAAITPTQQNIPGAQLVVISTAGTHQSRWLWSLVKAGRESLHDPNSRMAYVEYSADDRYRDDNDGDPLDPAALGFHPAVAGGLITPDDVTSLYPSAGGIVNIRRGFLNLWPSDMDAITEARDLAAFDAATLDQLPALIGAPVLSFDVAHDRSGAAIYAAWRTATGVHVGLVDSDAGAAWLAHHELIRRTPAWHDPTGYTGVAARDLPAAHAAEHRDLAAATAGFLAGIADKTITLDPVPELRAQFETATTRPSGGGLVFDPRTSPGPIDHLRAAALAAHKLANVSLPLVLS